LIVFITIFDASVIMIDGFITMFDASVIMIDGFIIIFIEGQI
jgi:hypothetical protein